MSLISVVSPVYKAERLIDELVSRLKNTLAEITEDFEIILVEDRSQDDSWSKILENCGRDKRIKGIRLSRNFGQHYAISAGLDIASGDWVVVMDCDLQDRPEEIKRLYTEVLNGFDYVLARRVDRNDSTIKRFFSYSFYKILGFLSGVEQDHTVANFGIYSNKVIDCVKNLKESVRYFPTMIKWVGFKAGTLVVEHANRPEGKSTYNFRRLMQLAIDIILAYSDKPIKISIGVGFLISAVSFAFGVSIIIRYLMNEIVVLGYSSLIASLWFLSGFIIMTLGVIGLYVGKIFEGVKNRPNYIIDQKVNL